MPLRPDPIKHIPYFGGKFSDMQKSDGKEDSDESQRSLRSSSRRNSVSLPRKNSLKKEKDRKSPQTSSVHSTPKRSARASLDFVVTGKQILKRSDRASSLPGSARAEAPRLRPEPPRALRPASRDATPDDLSLDLTQVSDMQSPVRGGPLAASTPLPAGALEHDQNDSGRSQTFNPKIATAQPLAANFRDKDPFSRQMSSDMSMRQALPPSRDSTLCSQDSLYKTSSSVTTFRSGTEDSSMSPQYSSSESPRGPPGGTPSPLLSSSSSSWADGDRTLQAEGEWTRFWADYNGALPPATPAAAPAATTAGCYDQCPTPYRPDDDDIDFELLAEGRGLRSEPPSAGLRLSPRGARRLAAAAHVLRAVLARAARASERDPPGEGQQHTHETDDPDIDIKKRTLTLDLKETTVPEVKQEEKRCEATTQTDISLPNTKSAPRIFENILRQLSRSSIDVPVDTLKPEDAKHH